MGELVHGEGVLVNPPGPVDNVIPEGGQVCVIDFFPILHIVGVGKPVVHVEEKEEGRDFQGRDEIALAGACLPVQHLCSLYGLFRKQFFIALNGIRTAAFLGKGPTAHGDHDTDKEYRKNCLKCFSCVFHSFFFPNEWW